MLSTTDAKKGVVTALAATRASGHNGSMAETRGFEGEIVLDEPANAGAPETVGLLTAKFVRYPGSQQIVLWLPQDGHSGYLKLFISGPRGTVVEDADLTTRLNGRVQILIDTLPWPPGGYAIVITHRDGWHHVLHLRKLEEGAALPEPPPPDPGDPDPAPIVYRDGAGHVLPNVDLQMRAKELARLTDRFSRRLEFEGNFRAGTIVYIEGEQRLPFTHEMCGGGVHFSIDIPPPDKWEADTGRPLADRADIVAYVAAETQRLKARSWRYVILTDRIDFTD